MKENVVRFRLAYFSTIVSEDVFEDLGCSGEGNLGRKMLDGKEYLCNRLEVQEIFNLYHDS